MNDCFSTTHLKDQNMSYCQHFCHSMHLSGLFCKGTLLACFHAFVPCCCIKSSSDTQDEVEKILYPNRDSEASV